MSSRSSLLDHLGHDIKRNMALIEAITVCSIEKREISLALRLELIRRICPMAGWEIQRESTLQVECAVNIP